MTVVAQYVRAHLLVDGKLVHDAERTQHVGFVGVNDTAVYDHFVQDEVRTLEVEHDLHKNKRKIGKSSRYTHRDTTRKKYADLIPYRHYRHDQIEKKSEKARKGTYVKLADGDVVLIEDLNKAVDKLKRAELVGLGLVDADDEEKRGVAPVDAGEAVAVKEGALRLAAREAFADDLTLESILLRNSLHGKQRRRVILGQTGLSLLVHHENKTDCHHTVGTSKKRRGGRGAVGEQE